MLVSVDTNSEDSGSLQFMGRGVIRGTSVCLTEVKGSLQSLGVVDGWVGFIRGTHSNFNKCVYFC